MARKKVSQKIVLQKFAKTNKAQDLARWLAMLGPNTQIKKVEVINERGHAMSFTTDMARIKSNLESDNF